MRRYGVRILVALLTFGVGLALSSMLGFFGLFGTDHEPFRVLVSKRSCAKKEFTRLAVPAVSVENEQGEPLKLSYIGTGAYSPRTREPQLQFIVENRSGKTVTGYHITGAQSLEKHGKKQELMIDSASQILLKDGESIPLTLPAAYSSVTLYVASVDFEDGTTWKSLRYAELVQ